MDGDVFTPQISFSANGDAVATWMGMTSTGHTDSWANHYTPSTGWGTATLIESGAGDVSAPQLGMDASGNAIAVWVQSDGAFYPVYSIWFNRYVAGAGWGTASLIVVLGANTTTLQLAVAANGQAIATWSQRNASNTGVDILAGSYTPGAGWGTASTLAAGTDATVIIRSVSVVQQSG